MDWQDQLEKQRDEIILPGDKIFMELRNRKQKTIKPLYIVTWQEETGNGIMGNQARFIKYVGIISIFLFHSIRETIFTSKLELFTNILQDNDLPIIILIFIFFCTSRKIVASFE